MNAERGKFIRELRSQCRPYSREELLLTNSKKDSEPLKAVRLSEAEPERPITPPSEIVAKAEPRPILHIASLEDWQKLKNALLDLESLKEVARLSEKPETHLNTLDRFERSIRKTFARAPEVIEEDSSEKMAWNIIRLLGDHLGPMLSYLGRNPDLPETVKLAECQADRGL